MVLLMHIFAVLLLVLLSAMFGGYLVYKDYKKSYGDDFEIILKEAKGRIT